MIKSSGRYNDDTLKFIQELEQCQVCKVKNSRNPRPRIALPRSSNSNHVMDIDLKENKRYKNAPNYALHFIDTFMRDIG